MHRSIKSKAETEWLRRNRRSIQAVLVPVEPTPEPESSLDDAADAEKESERKDKPDEP